MPVAADPDIIVKLRAEGLTNAEIAKRLGITDRTVLRWLKRTLGDGYRDRGPIAGEKRARILQLAADGVPSAWIAEEVGVSEKTVSHHRTKAGIPADTEWVKTQLKIRHDKTLARWHEEFRPKR